MSKSIKELTDVIVKFAEERDWQNNEPNHLISSIFIELGELAEHYQWQNSFKDWDEEKKMEVGFEYVDVIFYLFRLAAQSGIDIEKYFDLKVPKLEKKFPVELSKKKGAYSQRRKEYRESGKNKLY